MSLEHSPARQHRVPSNAWTIPREFVEWAKQHGMDVETLLLRMRQLEERLIGEAECRVITNLSRAQRWRMERDRKFPRRLRLGPRTVRWRLSEILAWIADLPAAAPERSPQQHGRACGPGQSTAL